MKLGLYLRSATWRFYQARSVVHLMKLGLYLRSAIWRLFRVVLLALPRKLEFAYLGDTNSCLSFGLLAMELEALGLMQHHRIVKEMERGCGGRSVGRHLGAAQSENRRSLGMGRVDEENI